MLNVDIGLTYTFEVCVITLYYNENDLDTRAWLVFILYTSGVFGNLQKGAFFPSPHFLLSSLLLPLIPFPFLPSLPTLPSTYR